MQNVSTCPKCGRSAPARALQGLCPRCLAGRLLEPESDSFDPAEPVDGRRFADYELIEEIARGGMGVIYRARQLSLNRVVALKFVAIALASPDFIERFQIEAEAVASLHHPNIVPIYEFGEHDGQPFFSMRPLQESLERRIAKEPLGLKKAALLVIKISRAAHFAHQRGIIHRDIKPSNILLDAEDEPFLADFGLAKLVERNSALTHTRAVLGTPSYISPEQALGKTADLTTAADVYSLGAVLYELITGHPPFAGGTTLETVRQVIEKEPRRPSAWNARVDRDLETICLRCLGKDPRERYASAEALAEDLERWSNNEPIQARPIGPWERGAKWARRHPAGALLLIVSVAALLAISIISVTARHKLATMVEERRLRLVRLNMATAERLVEAGDISNALHWRLQAMQMETDNAALEMQRYGAGALLRAAPQVEQMFFHTGPVNFAEFSPDGRRIVTASDDQTACVWDAVTGKRSFEPMIHSSAVYFTRFSPDGKLILTAADDGTARLWNSATGKPATPPFACSPSEYRRAMVPAASFSKDGMSVLTRTGKAAQIWSANTGEKIGSAFKHSEKVKQASFNSAGNLALTVGDDHTARIWDVTNAAAARIILRHPTAVEMGSFSPDGSKVATFAIYDRAYIWNAATGERIGSPLVHGKDGRLSQCAFSPDSRTILTVGFDNTLKAWESGSGRLLWETPFDVGISMADFSLDSQRVIAAGFDLSARALDAATGKLAWPILRHGSLVFSSFFDSAGDRVLTASENGVVQIWRRSIAQASPLGFDHNSIVRSASLGAGGWFVTGGEDGRAIVWDLQSGRRIRSVGHSRPVLQCALSDDGETLATLAEDWIARVWKNNSNEPKIIDFPEVFKIAMSGDGSRIVTIGRGGGAQLWDAGNIRPISPVMKQDQRIVVAGFHASSKFFVTASLDGSAQVWDALNGHPIGKRIQQKNVIPAVAFSPEGKRIATACTDATYSPLGANIWDVETGRLLAGPLMHRDGVHLVEFSPNGRFLATAGEDAVVRVWDASTGAPLTPPLAQHTRVIALAFSGDSRRLATGSVGGIARVWSVETGEPLTPPLTHPERIVMVGFLPVSQNLLAVGADGVTRVWDLAKNDESISHLTERAQILSSHRFDLQSGLQPLDRATLSNTWSRLRYE